MMSYMAIHTHTHTHTHTHYIVTSISTVYTRHVSHTHHVTETFLYSHHIPILNAYNTSIPQASHMLHAIYIYTDMSIYMSTACTRHVIDTATYIPHYTPS